MKRQLSTREIILIGLLAVVGLIAIYVLLFYTPMTSALDSLKSQKESAEIDLQAAQLRLEEKQRMEAALEEIFEKDPDPVGLAPYDNLQNVIVELNAVLKDTENYVLSFGTVDDAETLVSRQITLQFTSKSEQAARAILQRLHDSRYRCMLDDLSVAVSDSAEAPVTVNASLLFFEYQEG